MKIKIKIKSQSERSSPSRPNSCGRRRRPRRQRGGLSAADESPDLPLSSDCGPGCRTASTAFRVQLEIWIRHVIAARLVGIWLTPELFRLRRVT
jgi:hypothetical protein